MQKKKENLLGKIVKKNYNNKLEGVLEHKQFSEHTKSLLLSMLYKIEGAYSDYEKVKRNVETKDEYIENIISIIDTKCKLIDVINPSSPRSAELGRRTFIINKRNKTIKCYPVERKMLYAISKLSKKDLIVDENKYDILAKPISDLINIGNNINTVEPIRDFNGFSWDIVEKDIESIEYNLIYQNLRILVGAEFLNKWIYNREFIIDYFELFKNKLEDNYGEEISARIIDKISRLSVLLEIKYNKDKVTRIQKSKKELEQKIQEINNKEEFIKKLTKEKKDLNRKIKKIDTIINDKKLLQKEYETRNELLPLEKKIFSMRVLSNMMKKEREELYSKLCKRNEMLNPQKFIKYEKKLEEKYKYMKLIDTEDLEKNIKSEIIEFQKLFLECYNIKISKASTKQDISMLIAEFRYYLNIPFNKKNIEKTRNLVKEIEDLSKCLINKAIQQKILIKISNNENLNYNILKNIFYTKIINLENINIKITNEEQKIFLQMFDENVFDEKMEIEDINSVNNDLLIKKNKNIKIFIS